MCSDKNHQKGSRSLKKPKCRFPLFAQEPLNKTQRAACRNYTITFRRIKLDSPQKGCNFSKSTLGQNFSSLKKRIQILILFKNYLLLLLSFSSQSSQPLLRAVLDDSVFASNVSNCRNSATQHETNAHNVPPSLLKTTSTHCHPSRSVFL